LSREATRAGELSQCVHYERSYIENWSIELDLRVLLRALVSD
jgi:lipopolysaccharide/colanic/teichoic acid biosynthesis glycosyltransferase